MVKAVRKDLRSEVVGDQGGNPFPFLCTERFKILGITDLTACNKIFRQDSLAGEQAVAFGTFRFCAASTKQK